MSFCALEEAFTGPPNPPPPVKYKRHKSSRNGKEGFSGGGGSSGAVPPALPNSPGGGGATTGGELLAGPPPALPPSDDSGAAVRMDDLFPMPGETGGADEWQKAFTLEGSAMPQPMRPDGSVPVAGKSTLWRQIPMPAAAPVGLSAPPLSPVPTELSQRLDVLTRQLESLTAPTHLQGTAELFLFVAIGLLLLLAIDTLLRFAVSMGGSVMRGGGRRIRYGAFRMPRRWY